MKKAFSIVLVLVLMMGLCTSAFAGSDELALTTDAASIEVQAKAEQDGSAGTVYSVTVEWGAMLFTYAQAGFTTWIPETHAEDSVASGEWNAQGNSITVANHSNAAVLVDVAADQSANWTGAGYDIDVTITNDAAGSEAFVSATHGELENAATFAPGNYEGADKLTVYVQLDGEYTVSEDYAPVGNITVSFSEAP